MTRLGLLLLLLAACSDDEPAAPPRPPAPAEPAEVARARRVEWDHILIAFEGSYEKSRTFRSKEEARELAYRLRDRIEAGASFAALKREFSDDRNQQTGIALGPYVMVDGIPPRSGMEFPRKNMFKPIGDIVFGLKVGQVAVADWDARSCPQGWEVIQVLARE